MKHVTALIFAIALTLISQAVFASAVLVDAKGDVKVAAPGGSQVAAASGMELVDKSTITVSAGGSASVLLENGTIDQITAGSTYTVGQATPGGKRTNMGGGIALAMRELKSSGEGPTIHGMVREAKGPSDKIKKLKAVKGFGISAIYPRGTSIRAGKNVTFKWESMPPMNWPAPVIVIDDSSKKHIAVVPVSAGSTQKAVPGSKFKNGQKYSWYLATNQPKLKGKTMRFTFSTMSAADQKKLKSEMAKVRGLKLGADGTNLLVAQLYYQNGLYGEMVDILLPMWNRSRFPFIRKLLHLGYTKMGQTEKAYEFRR